MQLQHERTLKRLELAQKRVPALVALAYVRAVAASGVPFLLISPHQMSLSSVPASVNRTLLNE